MMSGAVQVRIPTGVERAHAGDLMRFAAGPDGAHQISNDSGEDARVVMFSSAATPSVAVYPDSDKVGVWTDGQRDQWMFRGASGHLRYFDGEPRGDG